ncbi:sensor histidine kinase [Marinimicrobium sp. ABcell2]|uniref:sensor histidine kinase n=1 Tax=Marinimicrobium sp. ABcell2 TaxID=3069751 RepID=UPI0027AF9826|nr:histidine kinase [Marinimicrobium sp. ABcell2]MDQ2075929.1 histidine kinase [Marinimicrobium sp. ABcell2]
MSRPTFMNALDAPKIGGISQRIRLFPKDRTFWMYQGTFLLLVGLAQVIQIFLWREEKPFNLVGTFVWLSLFTLGVLYFRAHYQKYRWQHLKTGRLMGLSFGYALGVALLVTLLTLAILVPLFWSEKFVSEALTEANTSLTEQLMQMFVGNFLATALFASAWIFVYLGISNTRRARQAEVDNLKLAISLKEARLASLSNQLNPHFLFNSLNNIRFMIHENPEHADHTITAFSEILRYSLESGRNEKVTLAEELAIVERYIEVVSLQLEERLDFRLQIPEALQSCLIPPMSLQLLVENAIKHGIDQLRERSVLEVVAEDLGQQLRITVKNPVPNTQCDPLQSTGTGLKNIQLRLSLLYGDAAHLKADKVNTEFVVTMILPKETS